MKLDIIEKMKNSASIGELNTYLIQFLNSTWIKSHLHEKYNWQYDDITEKDTIFLFQISKYKLSHLIDLKELGIPTDLSDYPKIQELVHELRRLNKESSAIYKKNNTHKKAELKRIKSESPEFQSIKSELDDVLEQIRLLEEKRRNLQVQYTSWVDNTVNEIEKDAGFINPNIRISELNKKLK